ncbi:MAG: hypothetical protein AAGA35_02210 [Patescibacteria group bacterium]
MEYIQLSAIALEVVIAILCIRAVIRGRQAFAGLALTFVIYVWYDSVRYFDWSVDSTTQSLVFLLATVSALYTVWQLTK